RGERPSCASASRVRGPHQTVRWPEPNVRSNAWRLTLPSCALTWARSTVLTTTLPITIRPYRCTGCGHVWRQDTSRAAEPPAKLSRRALRWPLEGIVCKHLTVARVSEGLGVEHRERRGAGRGQACVDRGPTPVRRRA